MTQENTIKQLKRIKMDKALSGDDYNAISAAIHYLEEKARDRSVACKYLKASKFPVATNLYTEGWNDAIDAIIADKGGLI